MGYSALGMLLESIVENVQSELWPTRSGLGNGTCWLNMTQARFIWQNECEFYNLSTLGRDSLNETQMTITAMH
jgi:hypothetical protein